MTERSLEMACGDCGAELAVNPWDERPARCEVCFERYLRDLDSGFLSSYAELGVTSRRTVAETCLRALVLEMPPARKVLAMTIMEQFCLASSDLIGLYHAVRNRHNEPIVRTFLGFRLDRASSEAFFGELADAHDDELLEGLGLPMPDQLERRYPGLEARDARTIAKSIASLVADLRATAARGTSALLLAELAGQVRSGAALTHQSKWMPENGLRGDQVAALVLDERRRLIAVQSVPVDEDRLAEVVDAIDGMSRASSNLIYSYLTLQDEEDRLRALAQRNGSRA
jgi:hypothetical protein